MCIEDIFIGRLTVDRTVSQKQVLTGDTLTEIQSVTIAANQFRVGLRLFAQVLFLGDSPELLTNRSQGWTEVWVDSPDVDNSPVTQDPPYQNIHSFLTEHNPTELLRIETEGLLVQRKFTLRPANLALYTPTDVIINISYTEYVFPNLTMYLSKNAEAFKMKGLL